MPVLQLLDLMHTLHTRAASIYSSWAEEERQQSAEQQQQQPSDVTTTTTTAQDVASSIVTDYVDAQTGVDAQSASLWLDCWCPLLQGTLSH